MYDFIISITSQLYFYSLFKKMNDNTYADGEKIIAGAYFSYFFW